MNIMDCYVVTVEQHAANALILPYQVSYKMKVAEVFMTRQSPWDIFLVKSSIIH